MRPLSLLAAAPLLLASPAVAQLPPGLSFDGATLLAESPAAGQLELAGTNVCRVGEDMEGAFISSDGAAGALRFLTKGPTGLQERARFTASGLLRVTPDVASRGEIVIAPDDVDPIHDYDHEAEGQMHLRFSRGACDPFATPLAATCDHGNPFAHDLTIAPYSFGYSVSYPGLIEVNLSAFSIHANHDACFPEYSCNGSGQLLVGDQWDAGGWYFTAVWDGPGSAAENRGYVVMAADRWDHSSHGDMRLQVRDAADRFVFQSGKHLAEKDVAWVTASGTVHAAAVEADAVSARAVTIGGWTLAEDASGNLVGTKGGVVAVLGVAPPAGGAP